MVKRKEESRGKKKADGLSVAASSSFSRLFCFCPWSLQGPHVFIINFLFV